MTLKIILATTAVAAIWVLTLASEPLFGLPAKSPEAGLVKIEAKSSGLRKTGTGFIVALDGPSVFVVTAAHVVSGDPRPDIRFAVKPEEVLEAEVIQADPEVSDLAVLRVPRRVDGVIALPLDNRPIEPAAAVLAAGFPERVFRPRLSSGAIAAKEGINLVFDEGLPEGYSGSPLLRDQWVVGLVQTTRNDVSYAVPAPILRMVLRSWKVPLESAGARLYESPDLIEKVYSGDLAEVPDDQDTRDWIFSYLAACSERCGEAPIDVTMDAAKYVRRDLFENQAQYFTERLKGLLAFVEGAQRGDLGAYERYLEDTALRIHQADLDAKTFITHYGCASEPFKQFRDHLYQLVRDRSPRPPADRE